MFERWHGGMSVGAKNEERERILTMAQTHNLARINTFYTQTEEKLIIYRSGGNATVIDYVTTRRTQLGQIRNCKVMPGESITTQYRLLDCDLCIPCIKKKTQKRQKKIKRWKINKEKGQIHLKKVEELVEQRAQKDKLTQKNTHSKVLEMAREELPASNRR